MLEVYPPSQLLVVGAAAGGRGGRGGGTAAEAAPGGLNTALSELGLEVQPLPRALFDDTKGLLLTSSCAAPEARPGLQEAALRSRMYLAFGAAGALLRCGLAGGSGRAGLLHCMPGPSLQWPGNSTLIYFTKFSCGRPMLDSAL